MNGSKKIAVIVNPDAANAGVEKRWPDIRAMLESRLGTFRWQLTSGPGHASDLTRAAVAGGTQMVVCVGGDGTLNEVINGLVEEEGGRRPGVTLGYIPQGTGCDLARHLSIPRDLEGSVENLVTGMDRVMDLGRVIFSDPQGNRSARYFHNMVSFGLGGEVVERVNRTSKRFGGFLSFIWATLITIFLYDRKKILLQVGDQFQQEIIAWNVAVANGQFHGGGMWEAPGADVSDGTFQITVIGDLNLAQVFWHFPKLYTGRIYDAPKIEKLVGERVAASSPQKVLLDVDGEQPGQLPVVIEMVPAAVRIIGPAPGTH